MDAHKRLFYEMAFELQFLKKKSNQFEDFFSEIMEKKYLDSFLRIRPYGKIGDKKCDGHLTLDGSVTIFQCYAPNEIKADETIKKIETDFIGAKEHWKDMKRWVFVHNDRNGLPPHVKQKIDEVKSNNPDIQIEHWGFESLRAILFELCLEDIVSLLGATPDNLSSLLIIRLRGITAEMDEFINSFPVELRSLLKDAFDEVHKKLTGLDINDLKSFLHKYRIPSEYKHAEDEGLKDILQILTLMNLNHPDWEMLDSGTANIMLDENSFRQILFSVNKETMPDIVLSFAERFKGSEPRIFKHPLIIENFRHNPKKNLCVKCGSEKKSYGQILIDFGKANEQSPFLEVAPNDLRELDYIVVHCANCIKNEIEDVSTEEELLTRLREVM